MGNGRVLREIMSLFPFAHEGVLLWDVEDRTTCIPLGSVMDITNHKDTKATWGQDTWSFLPHLGLSQRPRSNDVSYFDNVKRNRKTNLTEAEEWEE